MDPRMIKYVPTVSEQTKNGIMNYDIFSRVAKDRIIYITGEFNQEMFELATAQLLYLNTIDDKSDITLFVNSPGGVVYDLIGMVDTINWLKCDVNVIVSGMSASCAAVLTCIATGKRQIMPNATIMVHQVSAGAQGKLVDMEASLKQTKALNEKVFDLMSKASGKPEKIEELKKRQHEDIYLTAEEALEYGLVDEILDTIPREKRKGK